MAISRIKLLLLFVCISFSAFPQSSPPDSVLFSEFSYRNVGPTRGGRVTAVAGVESLRGTFYMGATGGGVWKTEDYGITWKNVSDKYFATPSIGAIRVVQSDPKIVYVGTGSDGIRSNVIEGKGVYKSTNAGKSWKHIGLEKVGQIGGLEIHPTNPDIIFVAAQGRPYQPNPERGVYRSKDAGKSWELVLFHSDTVGAVDIEFAPGNPDIVYATLWRNERKPWTIISGAYKQGGVYKSIDGGTTWKKIEKGLPQGLFGKADLAVSAADPNRVYVLVEAPPGEGGLYRSDDKGDSFKQVSDKKELIRRPFYYLNVDADPQNADVVFVNETSFFKSTDGGKSLKTVRTPHGDNHDMWINPKDSMLFVQANDGGVNVTTNGGKTWSTQDNQPTAELYQVAVDDQYPYWLYAGQQDNSTIALPSAPPYDAVGGASSFWMAVGGCETGPAVPKPGNPDIVYSNCKGRFGVYNKRTGQEKQYYVGASNIYGHNPTDLKYRFQRVSPIHVSIHNPDVVYHASQFLHKTTDDGLTWETISPDLTANDPSKQVISGSPITRDITGEEYYSTIYEVNESPVTEGVIWVGANDGPIHVTNSGGKNWNNATPKIIPDGGRVDCIDPSPHQTNKAYAAVLRYQIGDWKPYAVRTTDLGKTWTLLTDGKNGIPEDYPVRVIREDPEHEGLLYAGTEYGLFISFDDGKNWKSFQRNLPVTPITDIKIFRNDLIVSTMGRSFWIMDNISTLRQIANEKVTATTLFQPTDTHRFRYRGSRGEAPEYTPPGVILDYYIAGKVNNEVTIEILSADDKVVRIFSSKAPDVKPGESTDMATGFTSRTVRGDLKIDPGMHRFTWDMAHTGAWDSNLARSGQNGPDVSPGKYKVRFKVDGKAIEKSFQVFADPRVEESGVTLADMKAQEKLQLEIRTLLTTSKQLSDKLQKRIKELDKNIKEGKKVKAATQEKARLTKVLDELEMQEGIYMQPMLIAQISYLNSMLGRADQRPGKDAYERYNELKQKLDWLVSTNQKLISDL